MGLMKFSAEFYKSMYAELCRERPIWLIIFGGLIGAAMATWPDYALPGMKWAAISLLVAPIVSYFVRFFLAIFKHFVWPAEARRARKSKTQQRPAKA